MDNRIIKIAEEYGHKPQLQMLIEEMAELTKAICKFNRVDDRAKREPVQAAECTEVIENLIDEMADVQIMILQLQHFINLSDESFKERMNKKLDRQIERINKRSRKSCIKCENCGDEECSKRNDLEGQPVLCIECYYSAKEWEETYNKGNDCDCCENQYLCGRDGDAIGCKCVDNGEECNFTDLKKDRPLTQNELEKMFEAKGM